MRSIAKLSFLAVAVTVIASAAAFADDPKLQNQLAQLRAQSERKSSVAVYANDRGIGRGAERDMRSKSRFELRSTAHGQTCGAYVPAK